MANEKQATVSPIFRELFQFGVYKRNQGRIARQVTFWAILIVLLLGAWRLSQHQFSSNRYVQLGVPTAVALAGAWLAFRIVNMPSFADFLIAVEAEMNKVSWPGKTELWRSVLVVIFSFLFLALVLFVYDFFWRVILGRLGL